MTPSTESSELQLVLRTPGPRPDQKGPIVDVLSNHLEGRRSRCPQRRAHHVQQRWCCCRMRLHAGGGGERGERAERERTGRGAREREKKSKTVIRAALQPWQQPLSILSGPYLGTFMLVPVSIFLYVIIGFGTPVHVYK